MKDKTPKIAYVEPADYFPEEIRKKYKLGKYAEEDSNKQPVTNKNESMKDSILEWTVDKLNMSANATRMLIEAEINTLGEMVEYTYWPFLSIGDAETTVKALCEIEEKLQSFGFEMKGLDVEEFVPDFHKLLKYKAYYMYDYEFEDIQVAEGDDHDAAARELYTQVTTYAFVNDNEKWAFDIALDCVRNFTDEECEIIKKQGKIANYHFGYGMYIRNHYIHPSKEHFYGMADNVSSAVEKFIYAILLEKENA